MSYVAFPPFYDTHISGDITAAFWRNFSNLTTCFPLFSPRTLSAAFAAENHAMTTQTRQLRLPKCDPRLPRSTLCTPKKPSCCNSTIFTAEMRPYTPMPSGLQRNASAILKLLSCMAYADVGPCTQCVAQRAYELEASRDRCRLWATQVGHADRGWASAKQARGEPPACSKRVNGVAGTHTSSHERQRSYIHQSPAEGSAAILRILLMSVANATWKLHGCVSSCRPIHIVYCVSVVTPGVTPRVGHRSPTGGAE